MGIYSLFIDLHQATGFGPRKNRPGRIWRAVGKKLPWGCRISTTTQHNEAECSLGVAIFFTNAKGLSSAEVLVSHCFLFPLLARISDTAGASITPESSLFWRKYMKMRSSFPALYLALVLVPCLASAGRVQGPTQGSPAGADPGTAHLTGTISKHNLKSDLRINLQLSSDKRAGYVVYGESATRTDGTENASVNFDNISFFKAGTVSKNQAKPAEGSNGLFTKEENNYGTFVVNGIKRGTRTFDGFLAGTSVSGVVKEADFFAWSGSADGIFFDNLIVNNQRSQGNMAYYESYHSYYAIKGLRYGKYEIHSISGDDKNSPIIVYHPDTNVMDINMTFGKLVARGQIQFNDATETKYNTYTVAVEDPWVSLMTMQMRMDNYQKNRSFGEVMMNNMVADSLDQSATHLETRTAVSTRVVATEGRFNVNISSDHPLSMDASVDTETNDETDVKALLSYFVLTAYDSFAE